MKISVAMATYNGEQYLIEQLDSIRNQTRKVDEVIICDDRSKDSTVKLIRGYIEKYNLEGWTVSINEKNLGYADNFYKALNLTTGDYIFLSDQDDIWLEDKVETMIKVMEEHPEIYVLGSDFEPYYCTEDAPRISEMVMKTMRYNDELEHIEMTPHNIFIGTEGCMMCIRRDILSQTKNYWFSGWAHDEYLWKMALCLNGLYIYHHKTLMRRLHSNNASKRKMHELTKRVPFLERLLESHKRTLQYAEDLDLSEDKIKLLKKCVINTEKRIALLKDKRFLQIIPLTLFYNKYYHSKKSIPVELVMAVRGK